MRETMTLNGFLLKGANFLSNDGDLLLSYQLQQVNFEKIIQPKFYCCVKYAHTIGPLEAFYAGMII